MKFEEIGGDSYMAPTNTIFTVGGVEPLHWKAGRVEAHSQRFPLAGIAAAGLTNSTGAALCPVVRPPLYGGLLAESGE